MSRIETMRDAARRQNAAEQVNLRELTQELTQAVSETQKTMQQLSSVIPELPESLAAKLLPLAEALNQQDLNLQKTVKIYAQQTSKVLKSIQESVQTAEQRQQKLLSATSEMLRQVKMQQAALEQQAVEANAMYQKIVDKEARSRWLLVAAVAAVAAVPTGLLVYLMTQVGIL